MTPARDPLDRIEHYTAELWPNDEGWWPGRCVCGWDGGMYPTAEDAADALMDHARAAAIAAYRRAVSPPDREPS